MKQFFQKVCRTVKSAYRTAARYTARARRHIIKCGKTIYKRIKDGVLAYVNGKYILTQINQTKGIVQQAQSIFRPPIRFDYSKDFQLLEPAREQQPDFQEHSEEQKESMMPVVEGEAPNQDQKPAIEFKFPITLEWKPIKMTIQEFRNIRRLTQGSFQKQVKYLTCPVRKEIMRQPCSMRCCRKLRQKSERYAERQVLASEIWTRRRCILCHKRAKMSYIHYEEKIDTYVLGLRQKIMATYGDLDDEQRKIWKVLIDENFGPDYTEKHLENQKFIQ